MYPLKQYQSALTLFELTMQKKRALINFKIICHKEENTLKNYIYVKKLDNLE